MKTTSSPPPPSSSSTTTRRDETRSRTSDITQANNRQSRRSHVSISSNKRPSVNTGGANSSKTRQGMFQRAVPIMPRTLAILCFVLNLILPGTGNSILLFIRSSSFFFYPSYVVCLYFVNKYACLAEDFALILIEYSSSHTIFNPFVFHKNNKSAYWLDSWLHESIEEKRKTQGNLTMTHV